LRPGPESSLQVLNRGGRVFVQRVEPVPDRSVSTGAEANRPTERRSTTPRKGQLWVAVLRAFQPALTLPACGAVRRLR
jgi:hypothetical protein